MKNLTFKLNQITTATPIIRKNIQTHAKVLTQYFFEHGYAESWGDNQYTYYMGIVGHPTYSYSICVNLVGGKADIHSSALSFNYGHEFSSDISIIDKPVFETVANDIESIPQIDAQYEPTRIQHLNYCFAYQIEPNSESYSIKGNGSLNTKKAKTMRMDGSDNCTITFSKGWWLAYSTKSERFYTWFHLENSPYKGEFMVDFYLNNGEVKLQSVSYSNSVKEVRDVSILSKLIPMLSKMVDESKKIELDLNSWRWENEFHKKGYLPVVFKDAFELQ